MLNVDPTVVTTDVASVFATLAVVMGAMVVLIVLSRTAPGRLDARRGTASSQARRRWVAEALAAVRQAREVTPPATVDLSDGPIDLTDPAAADGVIDLSGAEDTATETEHS